jgi:multidrug resistance efflux pump
MKLAKRLIKIVAKLAVAAVVLVGFAAAIWGPERLIAFATGAASRESVQSQEVRFYTTRRQDLIIGLAERGTLRATRNVKVRVPFARRRGGQATVSWIMSENKIVKKGDLILQFEKTSFENNIEQSEEKIEELEKKLEIAVKDIEIEEASGAATIAAAVTRLDEAKEKLRRYREEEAPKESRTLIDAKRDARDKLEDARTNLADVQRDADEQLMGDEAAQEKARKSVEQARDALEEAEDAYDDASLKQKKFRSYDYPEGIRTRQENMKNIELDLERTRVSAVNRVENQKTQVRQLVEQIERTKQNLAQQKEMLALADVYAPVGGRLLYGDTDRSWPRPGDIKVGFKSWGGQVIMTIPDESVFEIDIYVAEDYRYRLKEGARALVTISAIPDLQIEGTVSSIDNFATSPPGGGPKKYKAAIAIDKVDSRLASGMAAEVEIITETVTDALVVPIEGVFNIRGISVCYVQDGDKLRRREVKTGKSNDHYVQILEGLELDERVTLTRPEEVARELEESAREQESASPTPTEGANEAAPAEEPAQRTIRGGGARS